MIPDFNTRGSLPPGVHETTIAEIERRLGFTEHRQRLLNGLKQVVDNLNAAGVTRVWIDGCFVTNNPSQPTLTLAGIR